MTGLRVMGRATASGYLTGEYATADAVKTLPLSPDFADTKRRRTKAPRVLASTQVELGDDSPGTPGRFVAGVDATFGRLKSSYADVASGTAADYAAAGGTSGPASAQSTARRGATAGFATWQVRPATPIRLALSSRLDDIRDSFRPGPTGSGSPVTTSHRAFSPRVGANVALPASTGLATNLYLSLGRVFKSATLDQLFDDRAIPIPVPPFSATVSNPALVPQRGTSLEGGLYQTWQMTGRTRLDLSAAAYRERI